MYFSGVVVAFFISLIIFMIQGSIRRKNGSEESFLGNFLGSLLFSAAGSLLSWFFVLILAGMILNKGVWGLNGER